MAKLQISLENDEPTLAIDRIIDKSGTAQEKPVHFVSEVLSSRDEITKEIADEQKEREEALKDSESTSDNDGDNDDVDNDDGDGDSSGGSDDDWNDDGDEWDEEEETDEKDEDKEKDDKEDKKDDKKDDDEKDDDKEGDGKTEDSSDDDYPSFESNTHKLHGLVTPRKRITKNWNIFKSLRALEKSRLSVLSSFGLSLSTECDEEVKAAEGEVKNDKTIEVGTGDVAYSKEAVIESLTNLILINNKYESATKGFLERSSKSIKELDERLMNFKKVVARGDVNFKDKLISDVSILKYVAYKEDIDLRESMRSISKFLKDTNDVVKLLPNNKFENILDVFASRRFFTKGDSATYYKLLPGFNKANVVIPPYANYFKTSPMEYQFFTTNEYNPKQIYSIKPVSLTEQNDLAYIVEGLLGINVELAVTVDLLGVVMSKFQQLSDNLKIIKVDVENDKYDKLNELGIDDKLKEFIVFKLIVEVLTIANNFAIETATGFITIIEESVELKSVDDVANDKSGDKDEDNDDDDNEGDVGY